MSKSMTAYGRASDSFSFGKLVVEIQSVNRKMRDIQVYLPRDYLRFDIDVRKWISSEIERGQVTVRVSLLSEGESKKLPQGQLTQLKELQSEWNHVAAGLGFDPQESVNLRFLVSQLQEESVFDFKEEECRIALQRIVHAALDELIQMKLVEGRALVFDIQKRLLLIEEQLAAIERKKEEPYDGYRRKITERLQEIEALTPELEERIAREIIFLAERMDVTEELVRLRAHIAQFRQHLSSTDKAVGRTLEFLVQEMMREANTLGSKSMDTDISASVVLIKSELEKIREQIQNIE
jgi:uncharacterized protein (TIGR00255 family)